ncbi:putative disease resistance protein RGA4 [Lolium rigidum]|uniref:putative disease resistance protein RGA4 n=1 Tax=Lolium rigidum TaxID=89674 RepID=UPI001F5C4F14|nr:putative disease resistance protein RGA4 [Lolium rigidum]
MELAISAVTEKQMERLQQVLLRARTVVEEADGRYITNSGMLEQLNMLAEAMYRGYWALGAFRYRSLQETPTEEKQISYSSSKRFRTVHGTARKNKATYLVDLQGVLDSLEYVVSSMSEFVVLLGGCDRMLRRPYDAYLYNDNIMFGRHAEKQKLLNFVLQHGPHGGAPVVLPVIGGPAVGKRTLVAHVCKDERVSSQFSSILHLNEDSICRIGDHGSLLSGKVLVVVELVSDVDKEDWAKFCSTLASMDSGSKVIIVSRCKNSEKLGTVKPIFLNTLPYEEFSYLFKTLAFGSADPAQHPHLAKIADELATELQSDWSLVAANLLADMMRKNLNLQFWLCTLSRMRRFVERNFSLFGEHPQLLILRRRQVDVSDFILHSASPLRIVPSCAAGSSRTEVTEERALLPKVRVGDLLADPGLRPQGDFNVVTWESRLPPYTSFVHFVPNGAPDLPEDTPLSGRKRKSI